MSVGGILGESWKLYTKFFTRFFVIAVIVYAIVNLVDALVGTVFRHGTGSELSFVLVTWIVTLVGTFWLQGALVYAVDDVRDGRIDTTIGQIFERVAPHLFWLILTGVIAAVGITIGFLLLVAPGLFLLTCFCLIVPVIVFEGEHVVGAFSRSWRLVWGSFWTVFGVVIITAILSAIASGIIQAIFSFLGPVLRIWIGATIANAIVGPFLAVALTLMYFALKELKEGAQAAPAAPAEDPANW